MTTTRNRLSLADARKVRGRVVTKEVFDPKAGTTRELASAPLVLARNGAFFEARIESTTLPAKLTAKISFRSDDKESRFDFTFPATRGICPRGSRPQPHLSHLSHPSHAQRATRPTHLISC